MSVKVTKRQVSRAAGKVIINNRDLANALVRDNKAAIKLLGVSAASIQLSRDGRVVVSDKRFADRLIKNFADGNSNGICGLKC